MDLITYLCNTTPSLSKLQRNLPLILPYVDRAVICIGERHPEAEAYCKSFDKVKLVYYPWDDSFKNAYQTCLDHAPKEGWHLRMDDDEVPSELMLQQLRWLINISAGGEKTDVFAFQCTNVVEGREEPSSYYREMFYKWNPNLRYEVDLHQSLVGLRGPSINMTYNYYHHKSEVGALRSAARDFFTAGVWADREESFPYWYKETGQDPRINPGGPLVPNKEGIPYPLRTGFLIDSWTEMWYILKAHHPEVKYYRDLDKVIREKTICNEFREWARAHNSENDKRPHLHEMYAFDRLLNTESK